MLLTAFLLHPSSSIPHPSALEKVYCQQLDKPRTPLRLIQRGAPRPGRGQVLLRVAACGVCRIDLHIVDGELPALDHPVVPGHEIVGVVEALRTSVETFTLGQRVGVPWLGSNCGHCAHCSTARENLCDAARFTGHHLDGGYAEYAVADTRYCFALPPPYGDAEVAPLLCRGLIGHRAYAMARDAKVLGLYGFGAAAHIPAQLAVAEGRTVYAYTRRGDSATQTLARKRGAGRGE